MTEHCQQCDGTGWARYVHLVPAGYRSGRIEAKPEAWEDVRVAPCDRCSRGLALAAAQAARRGRRARRTAGRKGAAA